ncbi:transporter substrate-binding protein [Bacillus piscicola]|uniref:transporter substrate-binding protein n=1 Tax=Bacillus piscicola TaxID=1632684 RepID=UPI001F0945F2
MPIKIGLLFSLTGTTAITEKGQWEAAKFALAGCENHAFTFEAVTRDIASDPIQTAQAAEELAKSGVTIFIGCYTSACRKAVLPILEKYGCLLVYPTLYEGQECHPHVFYTGEVPNQQVHTLLDYGTRHFGKRVYAVGNDYIYPRETNEQVKTFLKEKGGSLVGERYVPLGHASFYEMMQDILLTKPDFIFSTLVGSSIIPFYQTYQRMSLDFQTMPIFSPITKETEITAMGASYGKGHFSSASYFQSLPSPENRAFVTSFQQFTGAETPISSVMFNTFLGTKMVIDSIMETARTNYRDIIYHLSGQRFNTVCGTIEVDPDHRHLSRPVKIGRVSKDGQFETVWDSEGKITPKPFKVKTKQADSLHELILHTWGKVSEEAVIVLSDTNRIMYVSKKAAALTHWQENKVVTPQMQRTLAAAFHIERFPADNQQLLFLKQKDAVGPQPKDLVTFGRISTLSAAYQRELEVAGIAAQSAANVLILGETGTGKEVAAQAIHEGSDRKDGPFVAINTGILPKDLAASELFGFVEGAFTGARKGGAIGKFEAAHNGTLFLDEIGEMPLDLQVALLRALESKSIVRIGDTKERPVNARIIAATNRALEEEIAYGSTFRSDLFYRLNVLSFTIPPLRERPEDTAHLSSEFLEHFRHVYGDGPASIEKEAMQMLAAYHWPGNIRELKNIIERAFLLARKEGVPIAPKHLPPVLHGVVQRKTRTIGSLKSLEVEKIKEALAAANTVTEAASALGIARSTLYRKIKEHRLSL